MAEHHRRKGNCKECNKYAPMKTGRCSACYQNYRISKMPQCKRTGCTNNSAVKELCRGCYNRDNYRGCREEVHSYLGNQCAWCPETKNLEIDHIDPEDKDFDITPYLSVLEVPEWVWKEIDKCHLLCTGCHALKTQTCKKLRSLGVRVPAMKHLKDAVMALEEALVKVGIET